MLVLERAETARRRRATHSQVIEVIEVTSEELSTYGPEARLNPLANQIVTFST
jgi:hypothetical protein